MFHIIILNKVYATKAKVNGESKKYGATFKLASGLPTLVFPVRYICMDETGKYMLAIFYSIGSPSLTTANTGSGIIYYSNSYGVNWSAGPNMLGSTTNLDAYALCMSSNAQYAACILKTGNAPYFEKLTLSIKTIISGDSINNTSSTQIGKVVWNGSLWVAGGYGSTYTLAYSYDAINWTGVGDSTTLFSASGGVLDLAWNGSIFVAAGADPFGNVIATSSDGITWTKPTMPTISTAPLITNTGASVGTFTDPSNGLVYNVYRFLSGNTNTLSIPSSLAGTTLSILAVGGGGGGGGSAPAAGRIGGAGGAGGVVSVVKTLTATANETITIVVGEGGVGSATTIGTQGGNTSVKFAANTSANLIAYGGGYGGTYGGGASGAGGNGASGGASGRDPTGALSGSAYILDAQYNIIGNIAYNQTNALTGSISGKGSQGYAGGNQAFTSGNGAGAGGAGAIGVAATNGTSGSAGGAGIQSSLVGLGFGATNYKTYYWGGGGGSAGQSSPGGNGGIGGGGGGSVQNSGTGGTGGGTALKSGGNSSRNTVGGPCALQLSHQRNRNHHRTLS
jgi:hypothetical protein